MKKEIITMLTVVIYLLLAPDVGAQEGLAVDAVFSQKAQRNNSREVFLQGRSVKEYGLTLFRSLMVENEPQKVEHMQQTAEADAKNATDIMRIMENEKPLAIYMQLPPQKKKGEARFVLFRRKDKASAMLIYIEGNTTLKNIIDIQKQ